MSVNFDFDGHNTEFEATTGDAAKLEQLARAAIARPGELIPEYVDEIMGAFPDRVKGNPEDVQVLVFPVNGGMNEDTVIARTAPDKKGNRTVTMYSGGSAAPGVSLEVNTGQPEDCLVRTRYEVHRKVLGEPAEAIPAVFKSVYGAMNKLRKQEAEAAEISRARLQRRAERLAWASGLRPSL